MISSVFASTIYASFLKLNRINNKCFLPILLILSGDISLNPEPFSNNQSLHSNEWNVFRSKGIHLIHLNVNSLLPKIDEICYIAERTKAAVIGITESKLDESIFQSEIQIDNYDLLRCDRNRNGGGAIQEVMLVTCRKTFFQMLSKTFSLKSYCQKPHL